MNRATYPEAPCTKATFTTQRLLPGYGSGSCTIEAEATLDDDCRSGHADFSLTGAIYRHGRCIAAGQCVDEMLLAFPRLKGIAALHMSTHDGVPMYALENGWYHYKENRKHFQDHLRITDEETEEAYARKFETQIEFHLWIEEKKLPQRWAEEARQGIEFLAAQCADPVTERAKWDNYTPARATYQKPDPKAVRLHKQRVKAGYYTPEAKAKRLKRKQAAEARAKRQAIIDDYNKTMEKEKRERDVKLELLRVFGTTDGWIYYTHSNELACNWAPTIHKRITREQFDDVATRMRKNKLPEGLTFKWQEG